MKTKALYIGIAAALVASCSTREMDFSVPQPGYETFYAFFEQPADPGTKVYANEDLLLRWTADDRVSIFNKNTYNQQFRFNGETGDNAGGFKKVDTDEFMTGNAISHVVSVYPYREGTKIAETEVLTLTLPADQPYAENTFGLGANTMVSVTADNFLQYKNIGGYLRLSLFGEGMSVSSITLKGNNGEKLAGKATVSMPLDGAPSATLSADATGEITLRCDPPVALGATAGESVDFWLVVPPVTFSKGFTVTVAGEQGLFEKSTEKTLTIDRNIVSKMSPIEVRLEKPRNVIYYTSTDGSVVTPYDPDAFGANILSNNYVDGRGVIIFDADVTTIGNSAFYACSTLSGITIPDSVTSIGPGAFAVCTSLESFQGKYATQDGLYLMDGNTIIAAAYASMGNRVVIPSGVTAIGDGVFQDNTSLTSVVLPSSVTSLGDSVFRGCTNLSDINLPDGLTSFGTGVFHACSSLTAITLPAGLTRIEHGLFCYCTGLTGIVIPENVTSIGAAAFEGCTGLTSITIPENVTLIDHVAFESCTSLTRITVLPTTPPVCYASFTNTNNAPIYVPAESVNAYKEDRWWSGYADRIMGISTPPASTFIVSAKTQTIELTERQMYYLPLLKTMEIRDDNGNPILVDGEWLMGNGYNGIPEGCSAKDYYEISLSFQYYMPSELRSFCDIDIMNLQFIFDATSEIQFMGQFNVELEWTLSSSLGNYRCNSLILIQGNAV